MRNFRTGTPGGIKVRLDRQTVWSLPSKAHGRLFVIRLAPVDYESLRRDRIRTAMKKKLPKLQAWKQAGARTLLVLENGDMSLSNHWVILEAAEAALAGRPDRPDEIWLVDTTIESEWTVCCLSRDGIGFPDDETPNRFWFFRPSELDAVR